MRFSGSGEAPRGQTQHYGCTLTYVLDGELELEVDRPVLARSGSLILVPLGTPHRGVRRRDLEAWGLSFCPSCLGLGKTTWMTPYQAVRHGASPVLTVPPDRREHIEFLFKGLNEELSRRAPLSSELETAWLRLILGELHRLFPNSTLDGREGTLVHRALSYIETHALQKISLVDVAEAVHCSPAHLASVMKQQTGQTIGDWISAIRVSAAANWLIHSDLSVEQIAESVGWADRTHFTRQFKKAYGQTPAAFRDHNRGAAHPTAAGSLSAKSAI